MKMAFDAAYAKFREMELADVKAVIEAAAKQVKYKDNVFIETLWRNPEALEKFVLAKWSSVRGRSQRLKQTLPNALLAKEDSF